MVEVQVGDFERLFFYGYDRKPVRESLLKAFVVLGDHLWPSIVEAGLGHSYARSVLTSCIASKFFKRRGFDAEPVMAIMHSSVWLGNDLLHPDMADLGRPDPARGTEALHVVCRVRDGESEYVVDATIRQTCRSKFMKMPPEVAIVGTPPNAATQVPPEITYREKGFVFATRAIFRQQDDRVVRAVWLIDGEGRDDWRASPDARPELAEAVCKRLERAWDSSAPSLAPRLIAAE